MTRLRHTLTAHGRYLARESIRILERQPPLGERPCPPQEGRPE